MYTIYGNNNAAQSKITDTMAKAIEIAKNMILARSFETADIYVLENDEKHHIRTIRKHNYHT